MPEERKVHRDTREAGNKEAQPARVLKQLSYPRKRRSGARAQYTAEPWRSTVCFQTECGDDRMLATPARKQDFKSQVLICILW